MKKFERVKAVVSLDAIAHNFAEMKKNIAKGTKLSSRQTDMDMAQRRSHV